MQPIITNAQRRISFAITEDYLASLYGNIESGGIIQYHHILVVYGPDKEPCLFFCSEWNRANPKFRMNRYSVFSARIAIAISEDWLTGWLDEALFVLGAYELAREILHIENSGLAEGEAWAMAEILKILQRSPDDEELMRHRSGYEEAIRQNDERMVVFMKKPFGH